MWLVTGGISLGIGYPTFVDAASENGSMYMACTAGSTPYDKGGWVSFTTSTDFDGLLVVQPLRESASGWRFVDIGFGSTPDLIWENLPSQCTALAYRAHMDDHFHFPTLIPKGSTIKARISSSTGSQSMYFKANLYAVTESKITYPTMVHTYGADTASNEGLAVDPGGSINTKGSYTEITSATTHPYQGFKLAFSTSGQNTAMSDADFYVDVAFGGSGSEVVVIDGFRLSASATHDSIWPRFSPVFPIAIPEGTRVAVRASCDITDATDRLFDVIFYGIG